MDTNPPRPVGDGAPRRGRAARAAEPGILTPKRVPAAAPAGRRARGRVNRAAPDAAPALELPPVTVPVPERRARRGNGAAAAVAAPAATRRGRGRRQGGAPPPGGSGGGGEGDGRELRRLLTALRAVRAGDFSVRLPDSADPLLSEIATT